MSRLRDRATTLEIQINSELFDSAHVIASTLVSSNHRLLNGRRFGTLFIDEAAQALEAACWIAIRKADRIVLAGDHCQLPPTIKCYEAARGGLERTLMEKVVAGKPSAVSLLKVQYSPVTYFGSSFQLSAIEQSDEKRMMSSCMRYCTFKKDTADGLPATTFSIKVRSSPPRAAS